MCSVDMIVLMFYCKKSLKRFDCVDELWHNNVLPRKGGG